MVLTSFTEADKNGLKPVKYWPRYHELSEKSGDITRRIFPRVTETVSKPGTPPNPAIVSENLTERLPFRKTKERTDGNTHQVENR